MYFPLAIPLCNKSSSIKKKKKTSNYIRHLFFSQRHYYLTDVRDQYIFEIVFLIMMTGGLTSRHASSPVKLCSSVINFTSIGKNLFGFS